jgi:hypothetical protein
VDFEGRVSNLSGNCPNIRFVADRRTVVASGSTNFRRSSCRSISNGTRVRVRGQRMSDGTVRADRIDVQDDDGDDLVEQVAASAKAAVVLYIRA